MFEAAARMRSAPFRSTGVVPSTSDVVSETRTLTATEPATPTLEPPAPETDLARKLDWPGAVVSTVTLFAVILRLFDRYAFVPITATTTAMPTPTPEFVSVAGGSPAGVLLVLST